VPEIEGERVRRLVEVLDYDQTEVAAIMGGVQGTVSDWTRRERLTRQARRRLANLTADPEAAVAWLAEGAGKEMPLSIMKRAVSLPSGEGPASGAQPSPDQATRAVTAPADPRLLRAVAGLEMVLRELREIATAGGSDAARVADALAVEQVEGQTRPPPEVPPAVRHG